jgi:hypothetical protein
LSWFEGVFRVLASITSISCYRNERKIVLSWSRDDDACLLAINWLNFEDFYDFLTRYKHNYSFLLYFLDLLLYIFCKIFFVYELDSFYSFKGFCFIFNHQRIAMQCQVHTTHKARDDDDDESSESRDKATAKRNVSFLQTKWNN